MNREEREQWKRGGDRESTQRIQKEGETKDEIKNEHEGAVAS